MGGVERSQLQVTVARPRGFISDDDHSGKDDITHRRRPLNPSSKKRPSPTHRPNSNEEEKTPSSVILLLLAVVSQLDNLAELSITDTNRPTNQAAVIIMKLVSSSPLLIASTAALLLLLQQQHPSLSASAFVGPSVLTVRPPVVSSSMLL